jgi:hypothetical protein
VLALASPLSFQETSAELLLMTMPAYMAANERLVACAQESLERFKPKRAPFPVPSAAHMLQLQSFCMFFFLCQDFAEDLSSAAIQMLQDWSVDPTHPKHMNQLKTIIHLETTNRL